LNGIENVLRINEQILWKKSKQRNLASNSYEWALLGKISFLTIFFTIFTGIFILLISVLNKNFKLKKKECTEGIETRYSFHL
jgi:hypothetical protein